MKTYPGSIFKTKHKLVPDILKSSVILKPLKKQQLSFQYLIELCEEN